MARGKTNKRPAATAPEENRPINTRGETWQAVKLTGARAQKGKLPSGSPRFTYEVEWLGNDHNGQPWKNTYELAACSSMQRRNIHYIYYIRSSRISLYCNLIISFYMI